MLYTYLHDLSLSLFISTLEPRITSQTLSLLTSALTNIFPPIVNKWLGMGVHVLSRLLIPAKCITSSFPVKKKILKQVDVIIFQDVIILFVFLIIFVQINNHAYLSSFWNDYILMLLSVWGFLCFGGFCLFFLGGGFVCFFWGGGSVWEIVRFSYIFEISGGHHQFAFFMVVVLVRPRSKSLYTFFKGRWVSIIKLFKPNM